MPDANPPSPPATLRGRAVFVLVLLFALYILAAVDRQILAVMVDPIRERFALSDTQLGVLSGSAFALVYAFAAFPAARLADRHSRTTLIACGLALWSLCTGLFAFARSWWQLLLCRMGLGLGEACLGPMAVSLLADYFPARNLGKAMSVYILAVPLGNGLTGLLGGAMLDGALVAPATTGSWLDALQPWQLLLLLLGAAGFALLLLFVLFVPEPARTRDAMDRAPDYSLHAFARHLATHIGVYAALAAVMLTSALMYFGVGYWIPSHFTRNAAAGGLAAAELLYYWGLIASVAGALGVIAGGFLADHLNARHADGLWRTLAAGTVLLGIGFTLFSFFGSQQLELLLLVPGVFGNGILQAAGLTAVAKLTPAHMRGQVAALYFLLVNLVGAGLGPVLIAWLGESVFTGPAGLRVAMAVTAGAMSVASLLALARSAAAVRRLQEGSI
ncbi:MAG TPA: MFS transporter [Pseudomonadales bacterium]